LLPWYKKHTSIGTNSLKPTRSDIYIYHISDTSFTRIAVKHELPKLNFSLDNFTFNVSVVFISFKIYAIIIVFAISQFEYLYTTYYIKTINNIHNHKYGSRYGLEKRK